MKRLSWISPSETSLLTIYEFIWNPGHLFQEVFSDLFIPPLHIHSIGGPALAGCGKVFNLCREEREHPHDFAPVSSLPSHIRTTQQPPRAGSGSPAALCTSNAFSSWSWWWSLSSW